MLVRNHSDIFYSSVSEHVILVPLLAPLVPLWIELNNQVQKAYTCPFSGEQEPARVGFTHVYVCFGGIGGKGQYFYMPGPKVFNEILPETQEEEDEEDEALDWSEALMNDRRGAW